jgi:hypothetical protein
MLIDGGHTNYLCVEPKLLGELQKDFGIGSHDHRIYGFGFEG